MMYHSVCSPVGILVLVLVLLFGHNHHSLGNAYVMDPSPSSSSSSSSSSPKQPSPTTTTNRKEEDRTTTTTSCGGGGGPFRPWPTNDTKLVDTGDYRQHAWLEDYIGGPLYVHQHLQPQQPQSPKINNNNENDRDDTTSLVVSHLQSLPVPTLAQTRHTFLPTALPLAERPEEVQALQHAVDDFFGNGRQSSSQQQQAQTLQYALVKRQQQQEEYAASWLQQWWQQCGYLQCRLPVSPFISYFLCLPNNDESRTSTNHKDKDNDTNTTNDTKDDWSLAIQRASAALVALAQGRLAVCSGQMVGETTTTTTTTSTGLPQPQQPLCNTGLKYIFHTSRIPQPDQDVYHLYDPSKHGHVIVAHHGQFLKFDLVHPTTQTPLPLSILQERLQYIVQQQQQQQQQQSSSWPQLGWLTSMDRNEWAKARHELLSTGPPDVMEQALESLESAAFILNLDDETPETASKAAEIFWHGGKTSGANRWFDKTCQLSCTKNGKMAWIGEHSMLDAAPVLPLIGRIVKQSYKKLARKEQEGGGDDDESLSKNEKYPSAAEAVSNVFEECWKIPELRAKADQLVSAAKEHHQSVTDKYDVRVLEFDKYGKKFIKQAGFDNFDFCQMAMQLASYRLFGKQVGTYEATLTRKFLHGRTETCRPVSPESQAFVQCMSDQKSSDNRAEKLRLLKQACESHAEYSRKASEGLGVDRHFFGLANIARELGEEEPTLFSDPVFKRSQTWRMSTSAVSYPPGFGPSTDDGLGVGYCVQADRLVFTCTSLKENGNLPKFCEILEEALIEMGDLVAPDSS